MTVHKVRRIRTYGGPVGNRVRYLPIEPAPDPADPWSALTQLKSAGHELHACEQLGDVDEVQVVIGERGKWHELRAVGRKFPWLDGDQSVDRVAEIQAELTEAIKGRAEFRRGFDVQRSRVAELDEERESIIKTAENMGGRRPASALDAMNAAVSALREMGRRKADHQDRADKAEARVAELRDRLRRGIILVNAAKMGGRSAAPKLAAWADERETRIESRKLPLPQNEEHSRATGD